MENKDVENKRDKGQDERSAPVCPICGSSAHESCEFWAEFSAWWDSQSQSVRLDEIPGIVAWRAWQAARASRSTAPQDLAQRFHETYERLAPNFGYKTRETSAKPWEQVPEQNKRLMIAVCAEILAEVRSTGEPK